MGIKDLINSKMTMEANFMGQKVKISKLTYGQVTEIQEKVKEAAEAAEKNEPYDETAVLSLAIRFGVEGGEEITAEELKSFPLDELNKLTEQIMFFSGLKDREGK